MEVCLVCSLVLVELIVEMFSLKLVVVVLFSLELGFGSGLVPAPTKRYKAPRLPVKEPLSKSSVRIRTVTVLCFPTYMEVRAKADLFGLGLPVDPADLRLGVGAQSDQSCGLISASDEEYIIQSALTDCGTEHWVTEDALIYTNTLVYSPALAVDGLVRTERAVIPVECRYRRRIGIESSPVRPTWIPHQTTSSAEDQLIFSLRLMTSDWQAERGSGVYFLGDEINIEAEVYSPQNNLRVFFDSCVATTTAGPESVLRYDFISNNGCLVDSQMSSSHSHFLPRESPHKLGLQLDAFMFQQIHNNQIYISCTLKAYPLDHVSEMMSKACSFIQNSWRSVDGDDWTCSKCENRFQAVQTEPQLWYQVVPTYQPKVRTAEQTKPGGDVGGASGSQRDPAVAFRSLETNHRNRTSSAGLEQEVSVGPLSIFSRRNKLALVAPPRVQEEPPHYSRRGRRPIPHTSLWRTTQHNNTTSDSADSVTDNKTDQPEPTADTSSALWETSPKEFVFESSPELDVLDSSLNSDSSSSLKLSSGLSGRRTKPKPGPAPLQRGRV